MNLFVKLALQYLESHPEKVLELIDAGVTALVDHLKSKKAAA